MHPPDDNRKSIDQGARFLAGFFSWGIRVREILDKILRDLAPIMAGSLLLFQGESFQVIVL